MVVSACGKKAAEPKQRTIIVRNATLTVPDGMAGEVNLGLAGPGVLPPSLQRVGPRVTEHVTLLGGVELDRTDQAPLPAPATLAYELEPSTLPAGRTPSSVLVLTLDPSGSLTTLVPTVSGNRLSVSLSHLTAVLFVVMKPDVLLLGTPGLVLGGTSKLLADPECPRWIAPNAPQTAAIAGNAARFSIDENKVIRLDPPLTMTEIDESMQTQTTDEILKRGSGDAINTSVVYASLLAAKGHSVRLVGGLAVYKRGELVHKGYHQWAEAIIDGTPYYVETLEGPPHLVPASEAREKRQLKVHRACNKSARGVEGDPFEALDANLR